MANKVEIIIEAVDKASKELKSVEKELGNVEQAGKKSSSMFSDMSGALVAVGVAAGAVGAGLMVAKKAFEFGKEGAQLALTEERFNRLAVSIGTTGDALMKDLGPAMGGMISKAEMMGAATDFMSLGLVKSHDEAIRLANVSGQLGMNMNQLVLTLTNKTTMRFDALGVKVDGFKEKVKELEKQGLSAEEAFNEAFLQQAEQQLELVGSAAGTAAGQFSVFEANIKNSMDEMKLGIMNALLPVIEAMNEYVVAQDALANALDAGVMTQKEYNKSQMLLAQGVDITTQATEELAREVEEAEEAMRAATSEASSFDAAMLLAAESGDGLTESVDEAGSTIMTANEAMKKYTETLLFNIAAASLTAEQALILATQMGLVDEKTVFAYESIAILNAELARTGDIEEYNRNVLMLRGNLDSLPRNITIKIGMQISTFGKGMSLTGTGATQWPTIPLPAVQGPPLPPPAPGSLEGKLKPGLAAGGPVTAGSPYIVGERGSPEMFVPDSDGTIYNRNQLGSGMEKEMQAQSNLLASISKSLSGMESGIIRGMRDAVELAAL